MGIATLKYILSGIPEYCIMMASVVGKVFAHMWDSELKSPEPKLIL